VSSKTRDYLLARKSDLIGQMKQFDIVKQELDEVNRCLQLLDNALGRCQGCEGCDSCRCGPAYR
jgi:hypothetical protein